MDPKDQAMMDMCDQIIQMAQKMKAMMSGEDQGGEFADEMAGGDVAPKMPPKIGMKM